MNIKNIFLFLFAITLSFNSCKKEEGNCPDDGDFCVFVDNKNFKSTGTPINDFLSSLNENDSDKKRLNQFKEWLECKTCISEVEVKCVSCIRTNPPQSEMRIHFKTSTVDTNLILDILMDEPLKALRYHE